MSARKKATSWIAFGIYFAAVALLATLLDLVNHVFTWPYWGGQIGLILIGMVVLMIAGLKLNIVSAESSVLLAFSIGVLTIIPAILMGMGQFNTFWPEYFLIAFGMAAGSFLGFIFVSLSKRLSRDEEEKEDNSSERR
jgi:hypothetical protein